MDGYVSGLIMSIREFLSVYLPSLIVAGGAVYGYGALSNEVDGVKGVQAQQQDTALAVARLETEQKNTTKAIDRLEATLDDVLKELRKDN